MTPEEKKQLEESIINALKANGEWQRQGAPG